MKQTYQKRFKKFSEEVLVLVSFLFFHKEKENETPVPKHESFCICKENEES
jgi:hypothetical protein